MAVRITFDDYEVRVFDTAVSANKDIDRSAPFRLFDAEGDLVALVPDFGVRIVAIEA